MTKSSWQEQYKMPINVFSKENQAKFLTEYNKDKAYMEKIPEVVRNSRTGWPLLDVTLFSPTKESTELSPAYENAIGGGKCGFFYVGGVCFASLLKSAPGPWIFSLPSQPAIMGLLHNKDFGPKNIERFSMGYRFEQKRMGIVIWERSNGYSNTLSVTVPDYKETNKSSLLQLAFFGNPF